MSEKKPDVPFGTVTIPGELHRKLVAIRDRLTFEGPSFLPLHLHKRWALAQRTKDGRPRGNTGLSVVVDLILCAFEESVGVTATAMAEAPTASSLLSPIDGAQVTSGPTSVWNGDDAVARVNRGDPPDAIVPPGVDPHSTRQMEGGTLTFAGSEPYVPDATEFDHSDKPDSSYVAGSKPVSRKSKKRGPR